MAGLEIVVRPVVFPDIRPQPARSLPPLDDPAKGICEITGAGSFVVSFSNSTSWSASYGKAKEIKRRVDEARVYQKTDDGTINKENFVDIEVTNKLWMKGPMGDFVGFNGDDLVPTVPGRGFTGDDIVPRSKGGKANEVRVDSFVPIYGNPNIEIMKKNIIKESKE